MTMYHDNTQSQLDRRFHALSDPTRRAMLERLTRGPAAVSELAAPFGMALPTVMQHLKVLESSGLIRSEKQGRTRTCAIDPLALKQVEGWFDAQVLLWEARLDALDALALELKRQEKETS
ncbi:MAG: ArsR/SmtB family transcription factor [Paracoccaceae bacterium]